MRNEECGVRDFFASLKIADNFYIKDTRHETKSLTSRVLFLVPVKSIICGMEGEQLQQGFLCYGFELR